MSDFGVWESIETSDSEKKIASRKSEDKLAAAIYDVKDKYGEFLYASTAIDEFHDRVALVKTDMMKTVDHHLMPVTGVMRRVIKACKDEWRTRTAAPEASGGTGGDWVGNATGGNDSWGGVGWGSPSGADGSAQKVSPGVVQVQPPAPATAPGLETNNAAPESALNNLPATSPAYTDPTGGLITQPYTGSGLYSNGPSKTSSRRLAGDSVRMKNIPECDICKYENGKSGVPAAYDGKTQYGPWANMCEDHFKSHGVGLGTGKGQRFTSTRRRADYTGPNISTWGSSDEAIGSGSGVASVQGIPGQAGVEADGVIGKSSRRRRADNTGPAMVLEETFTPSSGNLVPEGNFDGYLAEVEQGAPEKAGENFIEGKARLAFSVYKDYCETNGLRVASIDSLDHYAENLSDAQYFQLASIIQRIGSQPLPGGDKADPGSTGTVSGPSNSYNYGGSAPGWGGAMEQGGVADWQPGTGAFEQNMIAPGQIAASRRQAAGAGKTNYLQKADEALTQVLESKAEEFQETIAPLQQALQVIQQAEQAEQAANPMGVQPPPGTVNVLPGQDPSMGGGDPSMGGGDPSMGGDPMAGGGGDLAQALGLAGAQGMPTPGPEGAQQQITGRQRRHARADDIAGYTYDTQNFEPGDLIEYMIAKGELSPGARGMSIEDVLDQHAGGLGIDRHDERSYDSSEHPKVIFESQLDPEYDSDWYSGFREGSRKDGGAYPFVRKGGILDQYNSWLKHRKDLPRGGEADYWAFARENGFGQGEVDSLKKHFQTTAAKVSLSDGEMGSYPRTSGVRGQRSGASPVGGSNRSSSTRESNPSGQGASAQRERKEVSRSKVGRKESNVAHPQSGVAGFSGRSQWSSGSSPQRRQAGQSAGESGVRNFRTKLSRYGSAQDSVAAGQNSLSRRASAGRAESDAQSTTPGSSTVSRLRSSKNNDQESSVKFSGSSRHPLSEDNGWGQRLAWTGFGPGIFARKVPGWEFDSHLNGYVTTAARDFTCSCGEKLPVPSYSTCKCGKVHNSYVIGTGGDNHTASIEKYICREIQVRPDVIVANRKAKRHKVTDPGALGDGEEDDLPTMKPVPQDWRRRNEHGQFSAKRR